MSNATLRASRSVTPHTGLTGTVESVPCTATSARSDSTSRTGLEPGPAAKQARVTECDIWATRHPESHPTAEASSRTLQVLCQVWSGPRPVSGPWRGCRLGGRGRGVAGIPDPPGPEPLPLTHWSVLVKKEKMTPIDQKSQIRQFDQINPNFGFLVKMSFFLQNGSKLKILHSGFKTLIRFSKKEKTSRRDVMINNII